MKLQLSLGVQCNFLINQYMQSPSPAPVQKLPIPQEHMPMVQSFDAMLERCKGRAGTTVSPICMSMNWHR